MGMPTRNTRYQTRFGGEGKRTGSKFETATSTERVVWI
jgi:hypothetical protein